MARPGELPNHPPCPDFNYTKYQVDEYDMPYETHLAIQAEAKLPYKYVANGAFVIDSHPITTPTTTTTTTTTGAQQTSDGAPETEKKILLIQRSAHDSWPGRWEIPGGACDPEDPSILYSVARELWEEAGLKASQIGPLVGGTDHIFLTGSGNVVCRFSFLVDVERNEGAPLEVKLDPREHQAFVWATEQEVRIGWVGETELQFTNTQTMEGVLEAFKVERELGLNAQGGGSKGE